MTTAIESESLGERELSKLDTAGSVMMTKELFEKLYLSPQTNVAGNLRKTFGNPTPLGLAGFLLALTPLSCDLLGWRGAGGDGAASVGAFFYLGGVVALLVAVGEFILGNSFSIVMFGTYGGFFLAYGATLTPFFDAFTAYADPNDPAAAAISPGFLSSIGYLVLFMGVFNFVMLICSIRTNIIYVLAFACLECTFCFVTASDFYGAVGNFDTYTQFRHVGGGFGFGASMFGWYLFISEMFAIVDFPIQLPVGDLSTIIKGASERATVKKAHNMV